MNVLSFWILISVLELVTAEWNTKDYMKREHCLIRPYQGSGMTIPYWDFMGSTMVTNNYIRLTPDSQSKQGAIWNSVPCHVRNWELQVHFKVHGKGKDLFGDGFVIWYARERMKSGPVFGNQDYFQGLAIILDTYSNHNGPHNHQHPYISAMVNNGSLHYDHDRDGTHTQIAGCEANFRNLEHDTHISMRYERDTLTVSTDFSNKAAWKECFSVKDIKLPTGYYFGISATTGDLSDNHDILSIRLFELDLPDDPRDQEDRSNILPSTKIHTLVRIYWAGNQVIADFDIRWYRQNARSFSCQSNIIRMCNVYTLNAHYNLTISPYRVCQNAYSYKQAANVRAIPRFHEYAYLKKRNTTR